MAGERVWAEVYEGGSPEAEKEGFLQLAKALVDIQEATRGKAGWDHPKRTLHAKLTVGVADAQLAFDTDLPPAWRQGYVEAGRVYPTTIRFSNASALCQRDDTPDMRGIALRVALPSGGFHDLLMTNFPVSHARNARQFVDFAIIALSGDRATLVARLIERFGEAETQRMLNNIQQGARKSQGLALESFWSRGAYLWGDAGPVRFNLCPAATPSRTSTAPAEPEDLQADFAERLRHGDVTYRLSVQPFVDEVRTPIEDGAVEWTQDVSPSIGIATVTIAQNTRIDAAISAGIDALSFNPWNAPPEFRPLGNLNRARGVVYAASAARWQVDAP